MAFRDDHCSLADVEEALRFVSASTDRDAWVRIGMAIKHEFGDLGFDVFDAWSASGDNYTADGCRSTWRSIKSHGSASTVTIATLFQRAKDGGWVPDGRDVPPEELARREAEAAERKKKREAQEAQRIADDETFHSQYADLFTAIFNGQFSSIKKIGDSPYLKRKGVMGDGVRHVRAPILILTDLVNARVSLIEGYETIKPYLQDPEFKNKDAWSFRFLKRGSILVPMCDLDKNVRSAQAIYDTGSKTFFKRSVKRGLMHVLGDLETEPGSVFMMCEGYATGATLRRMVLDQGADRSVVVTFDSGNMPVVAESVKARFPGRMAVVCCDNDLKNAENAGLKAGQKAGAILGGSAITPAFKGVESVR